MSGAVAAVATAVVGVVASQMLQKKPEIPKAPDPVQAPSTQANKAPDEQQRRSAQSAASTPTGAMAGAAGTMLTGNNGVNPGALNLGKNTLLGQ